MTAGGAGALGAPLAPGESVAAGGDRASPAARSIIGPTEPAPNANFVLAAAQPDSPSESAALPAPAPGASRPAGHGPPLPEPPSLPERLRWLALMLIPAAAAGVLAWHLGLLAPKTVRLPPDEETRREQHALWPIFILAGLIVYLSQILGSASARALFSLSKEEIAQPRGAALLSWGTYAGCFAGLLVVLLAFRGLGRSIGLRARFSDLPMGVLGFGLVYPMVSALGTLLTLIAIWVAQQRGNPPPEQLAHDTLQMLFNPLTVRDSWWWAIVAAVALGAPIVEEIIYRGFLQTGILRATGSPTLAVLATSLAFVLPHMTVVEPHALLVLFVLSVGMGIATERTGRLGAAIVMHILFNATNLAIAAMS